MPWRRKRRNDVNFFLMRIPVLICMGLCVSIGPAIAIVTKHDFNWFGIISALILCLLCVGIPLASCEIADRLDSDHETRRSTHDDPDSTTRLDSGGSVDDRRGGPHRCSCCGSVCDHHRWTR